MADLDVCARIETMFPSIEDIPASAEIRKIPLRSFCFDFSDMTGFPSRAPPAPLLTWMRHACMRFE